MKIIRWLDKYFEEILMITLLGFMVVIMGLQVFMRYVAQNSLSWPEEITRYMFIWFVFLGISYGIKYNIHIRVNLLEVFFPKALKALNIIQDLVFLAFLLYMVKPAIAVIKLIATSQQHSPAMQTPMVFVYFSLFLGIFLAILRMLQKYYIIVFKTQNKNNNGGE